MIAPSLNRIVTEVVAIRLAPCAVGVIPVDPESVRDPLSKTLAASSVRDAFAGFTAYHAENAPKNSGEPVTKTVAAAMREWRTIHSHDELSITPTSPEASSFGGMGVVRFQDGRAVEFGDSMGIPGANTRIYHTVMRHGDDSFVHQLDFAIGKATYAITFGPFTPQEFAQHIITTSAGVYVSFQEENGEITITPAIPGSGTEQEYPSISINTRSPDAFIDVSLFTLNATGAMRLTAPLMRLLNRARADCAARPIRQ